MSAAEPLLSFENLHVTFRSRSGVTEAVKGFDMAIHPG